MFGNGPCDCECHDGRTKKTTRGQLSRAVEQRELARRAQEAGRQEIERSGRCAVYVFAFLTVRKLKFLGISCRYYLEQKTMMDSGNDFKNDVKRMEREAKERAQEASLLDSVYQVLQHSQTVNLMDYPAVRLYRWFISASLFNYSGWEEQRAFFNTCSRRGEAYSSTQQKAKWARA